jgi:hypothetical protein
MAGTQDKIRLLNAEIAKLKSIEKHYTNAVEDLAEAKERRTKIEKELNNEYADIEALEKLTLKGVFHSILGDKKKQLEKARQDYLQVALKHNACKTEIETLEYEVKILQQKTDLLAELEDELKSLQKIRENELKIEDSPEGIQLRKLLTQIDDNIAFTTRIDEVRNSGKIASKKLSMASLALQEAKNWGNWDMMHKRHRMSDYYKHSAIDDAKQFAFEAKRALIAYERDLDELGIHLNTKQLDISSLSSFMDIFFDNLITDWIFQQKIKKTLANINLVIKDVKRTLRKLEEMQSSTSRELSVLIEKKEKLLVK